MWYIVQNSSARRTFRRRSASGTTSFAPWSPNRHRTLPLAIVVLLIGAVSASGGAPSTTVPEGMVLVPAGAFTMGLDQGAPYERPAQRVELPAFFIDRTEVTVEQYARFVEATKHPAPPDWTGGKPEAKKLTHPVVNVSWYDANAYARWAGKRLPTEQEWEKAARGGDGRTLPWGNDWDEKKANVEGAKGDLPLRPVGTYPNGASPCGALDMAGNAWEWTSDWFRGYPGTPEPSIHFGEKYRSVRGLGSINFYTSPPLTQQTVAARARVQPFGRFDCLGFRCVVEANGKVRNPPTEVRSPSQREKPVLPRSETPAEVAARYRGGVPVEIRDTAGTDRSGVATFGLPFPEGIVKDLSRLRTGTPLQARALSKWRDGSVRWALLDVPVSLRKGESKRISVNWDGKGEPPQPDDPVRVETNAAGEIEIANGATKVQFRKGQTHWLRISSGLRVLEGPTDFVWAPAEEKLVSVVSRLHMPTTFTVEDSGPLRARVRVEGWLSDAADQRVLRYRYRIDVRAGSPHVGLVHTFTHLSPRKMLAIQSYGLRFDHPLPKKDPPRTPGTKPATSPIHIGGQAGVHGGGPDIKLVQTTGSEYQVTSPGIGILRGSRAPGWIARDEDHATLIGIKHFWQQFPKAIHAGEDATVMSLWADEDEAFEADQGLSKTHEFVLSVDAAGPRRAQALAELNEPLFGLAPPDWYCATRGLGVLAPFSLAKYPQYEVEVEAASDLMERERPYGMRHFGDNYFGGPYKGINAYQNLEYDVPYNHFMQFARTAARKYLDRGIVQARHQGDIDLKHDNGPQWKHSPRHTTTEAELGHVFLRGLVASTWLTGDPEGLENAKILGDWLVKVVTNPRSQGNERQIGWSLYALTGIYEATWDERYLEAMKSSVDRLIAGQDALGRFDIRYDNRISFFYGITLSGFVKYHEVTGDPRIEESIRRIVTRLHGFYPEYGGRTLEGLAWLYARTGDPEVRLTCQRTWETTMAWRPLDIGGMNIFTTRFLPWVDTLGLACPREWRIPETGPVEDGRQRHYFRAASGVLFVESEDTRRPVDLVVLRHQGLDDGAIEITDLKSPGGMRKRHPLPAGGETQGYFRTTLSPGRQYRIDLKSANTRGWTVLTSQPTRRVWHVFHLKDLAALTPRVYFQPTVGDETLKFRMSGEKEGFKGLVVYDPQNRTAGVFSTFIEYGDETRHEYSLDVPVPKFADREKPGLQRPFALWSLDIQQLNLEKGEGMLPYFSTTPGAYFLPLTASP